MKKYLKHDIEDYHSDGLDKEYDTFCDELEKLTNDQLWRLLPLLGISFGHRTDIEKYQLVDVIRETTWGEFFAAYEQVTGRRFALDKEAI